MRELACVSESEGNAERGGERERERERERTPSRFRAVSTESNSGLNLMNCEITTCAETKIRTLNHLSHPGAPGSLQFSRFIRF